MNIEEKQLLLKDICARFPYGVKVEATHLLYEGYGKEKHQTGVNKRIGILSGFGYLNDVIVSFEDYTWDSFSPQDIKPYLRPMSSITEDEMTCLADNTDFMYSFGVRYYDKTPEYYDFLNSHHFDYRGLIEKGLAIEVTKENNPYKE